MNFSMEDNESSRGSTQTLGVSFRAEPALSEVEGLGMTEEGTG